ncbi:MAG: tRNA uridine-5-carboxymethylaminomethyl(34) synthesis GTPase MnmE [Pseudobdellovibrionaceae bacterium]
MENLFARADKTICAVSTAPGHGGVAIIRVSGTDSIKIVCKIASFLPQAPESHRIYYGFVVHPHTQKKIDEVLISFFARGKSFTNEDVCEISCHGNPLICDEIMQALFLCGASVADRGEFTFRAFMNGRIDLAQAESVLSLIQSQSKAAKSMALRQLEGHLSTQIEAIETELIRLLAHIEADIDFSTEDLETISKTEASQQMASVISKMSIFINDYEQGKLLRDGIHVSFFGLPNVGKSSLFNRLVQNERAIVTNIPGTTRDVLEGTTTYKGVRFHFFDTAGIRSETSDEVERLGIERSHSTNRAADISLFVTEAFRPLRAEEIVYLDAPVSRKVILVENKNDLSSDTGVERFPGNQRIAAANLNAKVCGYLQVSSLSDRSRDLILDSILSAAGVDLQREDTAVLSQSRHYELLRSSRDLLVEAHRLTCDQLGLELVALELKSALLKIQEILGKHYDDQILDQIFKEFCLGK